MKNQDAHPLKRAMRLQRLGRRNKAHPKIQERLDQEVDSIAREVMTRFREGDHIFGVYSAIVNKEPLL